MTPLSSSKNFLNNPDFFFFFQSPPSFAKSTKKSETIIRAGKNFRIPHEYLIINETRRGFEPLNTNNFSLHAISTSAAANSPPPLFFCSSASFLLIFFIFHPHRYFFYPIFFKAAKGKNFASVIKTSDLDRVMKISNNPGTFLLFYSSL